MVVIRIDTREHISPQDELAWRRWQESNDRLTPPAEGNGGLDLNVQIAELAELVMMPATLTQ